MPKTRSTIRRSNAPSEDGDLKKFRCDQCPMKFKRNSDLKRHNWTHGTVRPYICNEPGCGKGFNQMGGLLTHLNTHTGEKPHKCPYCEKTFGDPASRTRHKKEAHQPGCYRCQSCGTMFKRQRTLEQHMKKHTDPYMTGKEVDRIEHFVTSTFPQSATESGYPAFDSLSAIYQSINVVDNGYGANYKIPQAPHPRKGDAYPESSYRMPLGVTMNSAGPSFDVSFDGPNQYGSTYYPDFPHPNHGMHVLTRAVEQVERRAYLPQSYERSTSNALQAGVQAGYQVTASRHGAVVIDPSLMKFDAALSDPSSRY